MKKHTTYQNLWDNSAVIGGKFIALNVYIRQEKRPKINTLSINLTKIEKADKHNLKKAEENK